MAASYMSLDLGSCDFASEEPSHVVAETFLDPSTNNIVKHDGTEHTM